MESIVNDLEDNVYEAMIALQKGKIAVVQGYAKEIGLELNKLKTFTNTLMEKLQSQLEEDYEFIEERAGEYSLELGGDIIKELAPALKQQEFFES